MTASYERSDMIDLVFTRSTDLFIQAIGSRPLVASAANGDARFFVPRFCLGLLKSSRDQRRVSVRVEVKQEIRILLTFYEHSSVEEGNFMSIRRLNSAGAAVLIDLKHCIHTIIKKSFEFLIKSSNIKEYYHVTFS